MRKGYKKIEVYFPDAEYEAFLKKVGNVKPLTVSAYKTSIKNHLKPNLGAIKLEALNTHTIQSFYNDLGAEKDDEVTLSAKTIKNIHGILHRH